MLRVFNGYPVPFFRHLEWLSILLNGWSDIRITSPFMGQTHETAIFNTPTAYLIFVGQLWGLICIPFISLSCCHFG